MPTNSMIDRNEIPSGRPPVSTATIAILGGVLIGLGMGQKLSVQYQDICISIGLLSVVIYIGLELTARYRAKQNQMEAQLLAEKLMETRLEKRVYCGVERRVNKDPAFVYSGPERRVAKNENSNSDVALDFERLCSVNPFTKTS